MVLFSKNFVSCIRLNMDIHLYATIYALQAGYFCFFCIFQNQLFKKLFQEDHQCVKQPAWIQVRPDALLARAGSGFLESGLRCIREGD